jgi:hypothetical protein
VARSQALLAVGGAVHFPRQVIALCQESLRLRDEHQAGRLSADDLAGAALALACQLEAMTQRPKQNSANECLSKHLRKHVWEWFWFLPEPGMDATSWRCVWVLSIAKSGAATGTSPVACRNRYYIMSVVATCFRHKVCPLDYLSRSLQTWSPQLIPP